MIVRLALASLVAIIGVAEVAYAAPVGTGLTLEQEARAAALYGQLKCPVCKNQSLASSTTFLADEMKAQIRDFVRMGATDEEILSHYVQRYGEWILLAPPARGRGLLAWVVPGVLGAAGLFAAWAWLRRNSKEFVQETVATSTLSGDERRAIDALVGD